jgi:hypothetical protein
MEILCSSHIFQYVIVNIITKGPFKNPFLSFTKNLHVLFRIAAFSALGLEYNVWQNFLNVREETKLATNQDDAPHQVVWFNYYTVLTLGFDCSINLSMLYCT